MAGAQSFSGARRQLVEQVRDKGISSAPVLAALGRVPRERFVSPDQQAQAYLDEALPIAAGQTISQPFTVAYQTEWLQVGPGDRVLEVGTGSGYQAAVLAELGCAVWTIERHAALQARSQRVLRELGYRVHQRLGDGTRGWPEEAPFDAILVTAGGSWVPAALLEQLIIPREGRPGGRLVIPLGETHHQVMTRFTRQGPDEVRREEGDVFRFVPLIADGPG